MYARCHIDSISVVSGKSSLEKTICCRPIVSTAALPHGLIAKACWTIGTLPSPKPYVAATAAAPTATAVATVDIVAALSAVAPAAAPPAAPAAAEDIAVDAEAALLAALEAVCVVLCV